MIELDGTDNKSKLGANGILAVSLAVARVSVYPQVGWLGAHRLSTLMKGTPGTAQRPADAAAGWLAFQLCGLHWLGSWRGAGSVSVAVPSCDLSRSPSPRQL
jgi:hypothetical protein